MKLRIGGLMVALVAVAAYVGACNVKQPSPGCPVQHGDWAVKYTLKTGTGACANLSTTEPMISFEKYNVPGTQENKLAVRPMGLGNMIDNGRMDPADPRGQNATALAKLDYLPGADDFCNVKEIPAAQQAFEEIPPTFLEDGGIDDPGAPAVTMKYQYKNMKVLVNANAPGTQMIGEVEYTEDNCTATYKMIGMWPPVSCDDGTGTADLTLCDPNPDYDAGRSLGSGINPTFKYVCDPDILMCMIATDPPSFK